jgi:hypothetical protein
MRDLSPLGADGATVVTQAPPRVQEQPRDQEQPMAESPAEIPTAVVAPRFTDGPTACSRCGMPVTSAQVFCGHCGQRLH